MKYNSQSHITKLTEVVIFFEHLLYERKVSFHPDDDFVEYVSSDTGEPSFTSEEVAVYNNLMNESFDVCEKAGVEIYSIGLASMMRLIDPSVDDEIMPGYLVRIKDDSTIYQVGSIDEGYQLNPVDDASGSIYATRECLRVI